MSIPASELHAVVKAVAAACECRRKGTMLWCDAPAVRGIVWVQRTQWGDATLYVNVGFALRRCAPGKAPLVRDLQISVRAEGIPRNPHVQHVHAMMLASDRPPATAAQTQEVLIWCCRWMIDMAHRPITLARLLIDQSSWWYSRDCPGTAEREWAKETLARAANARSGGARDAND